MVKWQSSTNPAPGPKGLPLVGSALDVQKDLIGFLSNARYTYGDIYSFNMTSPIGKLLTHVVQRPSHVEHVLKDNHRGYRKAGTYTKHMRAVIGNGLLTSEGEFWQKHRRIIQPAFHRKTIQRLADGMVAPAEEMVEQRWKAKIYSGEPIDVFGEMTTLALNIAARSLFTTDLKNETSNVRSDVKFLLRYTDRRVRAIARVPEQIPTPARRRYLKALSSLDSLIYRIIREGRTKSTGDGDANLISLLSAIRDDETEAMMPEDEIRDEVLTLLIAGHETSAAALSWSFYLLATHPEVYKDLVNEFDEVLGSRAPTAADFPKLAYAQMVFKETMRLYPPIWGLPRIAVEDDEIDGYVIPKETRVLVSPYLTHRDPQLWSDPEVFDPSRFAKSSEQNRPRFAYLPFGGGPRQCLGNNFAMMEGVLVLATVAQRYRPKVVSSALIRPEVAMTLRPRESLPLQFEPRN